MTSPGIDDFIQSTLQSLSIGDLMDFVGNLFTEVIDVVSKVQALSRLPETLPSARCRPR